MGPYFQQPRKKINQKAQGKKKLAGGGPYVPPPRHLVVKGRGKRIYDCSTYLIVLYAPAAGNTGVKSGNTTLMFLKSVNSLYNGVTQSFVGANTLCVSLKVVRDSFTRRFAPVRVRWHQLGSAFYRFHSIATPPPSSYFPLL